MNDSRSRVGNSVKVPGHEGLLLEDMGLCSALVARFDVLAEIVPASEGDTLSVAEGNVVEPCAVLPVCDSGVTTTIVGFGFEEELGPGIPIVVSFTSAIYGSSLR